MFKHFPIVPAALLLPAIAVGAVFTVAGTASAQEIVTCQSSGYDRNICRIDTGGRVRLVRQLSDTSCDGNWGYNRDAIWVRRGCRAEFLVGNDRRYDRDRDRYDRDDRRYNRNGRYRRNDRYDRNDRRYDRDDRRYDRDRDRYNRNDRYDRNRDRR